MKMILKTAICISIFMLMCKGGRSFTGGDIVLTGGSRPSEGTVLLYLNGRWGSICDTYWGYEEAATVCKQLGFQKYHSLAATKAFYGKTQSPSHGIYITCRRRRRRLNRCGHHRVYSCHPEKAAGVQCQPELDMLEDIEIRLVENTTKNAGGVEMKWKGNWGAVCGDIKNYMWPKEMARWTCKKLGFTGRPFPMSMPVPDVYPLRERKVWLDTLSCPPGFVNITSCLLRPLGNAQCQSSKMAGVICDSDLYPHEGDTEITYRLTNRPHDRAGMIEVFRSGMWQGLPSQDVSYSTAEVICREQGYNWGGYLGQFEEDNRWYSHDREKFNGFLWSVDIQCDGHETALKDCVTGNWSSAVSRSGNRAWVECFDKPHASDPVVVSEPAMGIKAGDKVTVMCSSGNGNQLPHLFLSCLSFNCGYSCTVSGNVSENMVYKNFTFNADKHKNGKACTCSGLSNSHWFPSTQIRFNISYGPEKLKLSISSPIREHHEVTATCNVTGSNPIPQLFWYLGGELIGSKSPIQLTGDDSEGFNVLQTFTFIAHKNHTGKKLKCAALVYPNLGLITRSESLTVDTAPIVTVAISPNVTTVGQSANFTCQVFSQPKVEGFWRDQKGKIASTIGNFVLQRLEVTDSGTYTCFAKGVHGDIDWASHSLEVRPSLLG